MPQFVQVRGSIKEAGKVPSSIKPDPAWGSTYSQRSAFTVVIADRVKAHVFWDERLPGFPREAPDFVKGPATIARVIGRVPSVNWRVDAEPIGSGRLGLVIYNERGKAMLAGTFKLKDGVMKLRTLYPGVTNKCKQTASVKVTVETEDGTTIEGEYSIEYEA